MDRKRVVLLAGRSFTGTCIASKVLSSGKDVAAIVVETEKPGGSRKKGGKHPFWKALWYLRVGEVSEIAHRILTYFWKSPYEWRHAVNRWKEICAARIRAFFSPMLPYAEKRKQGSYFFFEDLGKLYHVPILTVANLNHPDSVETIRRFSPDVLIICGTRKLLPEVLSVAPSGVLNIHGSLLPKYRGLMAEFWALYHGDEDAIGVTIHYADAGLDTGDIVLQEKTEVNPEDTFRSLRFKNTLRGAHLMVEALTRIEEGTVKRIPQPKEGYPTFHQPSFSEREKLFQRLKKKRKAFSLKITCLIFLLSFGIRIAFALERGGGWHLTGDEVSYHTIASALTDGKGYISRGNNTRPPGYPIFLMAHYLLFGQRFWPVWITQAFLGSLTVLLLGSIARRYFSGPVAWAAVVLAIIEPALVVSSARLLSECLSAFLLMLSVWLFQHVREKGTVGKCVGLGGALGVLVLTRGVMIFFPLFLFLGFLGKGAFRRHGRSIFLSIIAFFLVVSPWMIRNDRVYGVPLINAPQSGEVFYFANNPPEGKRFGVRIDDATVIFARSHFPDEVERERFLFKEGFKHLLKSPGNALRLWTIKFLMFWSPFDWELLEKGRYNGVYGFFLPFSLVGMVLLRRTVFSYWGLFAPVLYSIGMALVFYGSPRFRMPLHPFLILFASIPLALLWKAEDRGALFLRTGLFGFLLFNLVVVHNFDEARFLVHNALHLLRLWS